MNHVNELRLGRGEQHVTCGTNVWARRHQKALVIHQSYLYIFPCRYSLFGVLKAFLNLEIETYPHVFCSSLTNQTPQRSCFRIPLKPCFDLQTTSLNFPTFHHQPTEQTYEFNRKANFYAFRYLNKNQDSLQQPLNSPPSQWPTHVKNHMIHICQLEEQALLAVVQLLSKAIRERQRYKQ